MGSIKLSNEINKNIIKKLKESELDKNIEDFINDALKLEYSVLDEKRPVLKSKYLKLIDEHYKG